MLASGDIDAAQRGRAAQDQGRIVRRLDQAAGLAHFRDHRLEMLAAGAVQRQLAAGQCARHEVGAGFYTVRDDGVLRPRQCVDAVHANGRGAGAFDARSHLGQQLCQVDDLRLAGGILEQALAVGQGCGHQQVFGAGHRGSAELDATTDQASPRGYRLDVAAVLPHRRAERLESVEVHVDRPRPDRAPAGQGNTGATAAGSQRSQHEARCPHGLDQFVWGNRIEVAVGPDGIRIGPGFHLGADAREQVDHCANVDDIRHASQDHWAVGQQAGGQGGKRGVLGAADLDAAA